ncbi:metal-dependent hydrolase, beta-lactamase superfamily II [Schinkia azotoformans MEV2011]|uniref:Metal-dependent hydrolase, beta-lactamase superfamily II n=1 Tax=Schinkia azotoformans MEV2011 TaxID=1348973 RepID=A0A072NGG1_SCHAZ|nr:MBL fold metallo-hydrolase [Schinkia azotoformans]KEF36794.1 metal-dependent hydrolase, beta-lactamase superfamily II [Schinkia azotoformans MEV2011]MEC1698186.1 MBL fold metallo-hydrolase [Schinkia azotoformans]MEC1718023.1 MBL fold metallo-hydrolase [Schinkia azotoformans]MEC1725221.1 MBL fold metallo-hydrolase [Schinkia azotoformans]MEC1739638.1 MBL fold metallo-hydrolase [Schinkia azotoformans]
MKLSVLVDNNTLIDRYFLGEPALSFFIEDDGKRILFDTGYSDIYIRNADKMKIDLRNLDYVVLSHGHVDHTWGLTHIIRLHMETKNEKMIYNTPTVIGHPLIFNTKLFDSIGEIGSILSHEKLSRHFPVHLTKDPLWLTDRLVFLGEIKRTFDFEGIDFIGQVVLEQGNVNDYIRDDTAIVYKASEGLVIIAGCSHSGICNIVEHAKEVCQEDRIVDIIGGFHLQNPTKKQLDNTVQYIKELNPIKLHACHCTDLKSKIALSRVANIEEVGVGLQLSYF